MQKLQSSALLVAVVVLLAAGTIWAGEDTDTEYLMKVGDYFDVSYEEVDVIASGNIPIEEVPTVFHMARLSKKSPKEVLAIRETGLAWADFMQQNYIHPSEVLINIYRIDSPECRAINDKIKNKPLKRVKFADEDINVMVNYKFLAATYNVKYADLIETREGVEGKKTSFVDINHMSPDRSELANSK